MKTYQWKDLTFWRSKDWLKIKSNLARSGNIQPDPRLVFRPLIMHDPKDVRVVIIGSEPYPYTGLAIKRDGFAYSVPAMIPTKDGLPIYENTQQARLFKELVSDIGCPQPKHGSLLKWVRQGVMLWNFCPTGVPGNASAHNHWGWDSLSREVLEMVALENPKAIFVPWGCAKVGDNSIQSIVTSTSIVYQGAGPDTIDDRNWYGSKPFSNINKVLKQINEKPINWNVNF